MKAGFLLLVFSLLLNVRTTYAQKPGFISRYWNKLINDTTQIAKPRFLIYPTLAYAPETSWELGLSSIYVFYAREDTTNRLSEITGFTFFTLENQFGLWFDHALYGHRNKWIFPGRFRFQNFPVLYYGIGPNSSGNYLAR
jgi:hypothetical protein